MNRRTQTTKNFFIALSFFILGCIFVSSPKTADPATAEVGTPMPSLAELATAGLPPTNILIATVFPPVFDPETLGDNRELDSFMVTRMDKTTGGAELIDNQDTIGYIKEPFSAYRIQKSFLEFDNKYVTQETYLIGGRQYAKSNLGDWYYSLKAAPDEVDILQREADMRAGYIAIGNLAPITAQFIGQEDFEGIPANHFTFDQTDLKQYDRPTPAPGDYKIEAAEGDFYLAQYGNYVLYFHVKVTGNVYPVSGSLEYSPAEREITEALSAINQVTEFDVPADYLALNLVLDPDLPLPGSTTLVSIVHYNDIFAVDHYGLTASVSRDEFLEFYRNLAPTNGWTVSHIGEVINHSTCGSEVCVIINKGATQIILIHSERQDPTGTYYFIVADHDTLHWFDVP